MSTCSCDTTTHPFIVSLHCSNNLFPLLTSSTLLHSYHLHDLTSPAALPTLPYILGHHPTCYVQQTYAMPWLSRCLSCPSWEQGLSLRLACLLPSHHPPISPASTGAFNPAALLYVYRLGIHCSCCFLSCKLFALEFALRPLNCVASGMFHRPTSQGTTSGRTLH